MELAGAVAVVTGGAVRVGRALVLALAGRGVRVAVHYGSSAEAAESAVAEARGLGAEAFALSADLADEAAVGRIVPAVRERFGAPVDILINSASIFEAGAFAKTTSAQWDRHFLINLKAPFLLTQAFAAQVEEGRTGKVVNLNDWRGFRPADDHFAYTMSKGALIALTRGTAIALAPRVHVNCLALGAILPPESASEARKARIISEVPLGRWGGAEEVARAMLYLLESDYVTGETVFVDGGRSLV